VADKIKKIAKKRDLTEGFVETIIAGADNGFLKGWRTLVYQQKLSIWTALEKVNETHELFRLQGMLSAYRKIENRIDEVLEDYKNE